jgi:hypothetical protein
MQSVPPLYEALKRIWAWIETEPSKFAGGKLDDDVGKREAWWEHITRRVQEHEQEVLCLT